jgi:hypothetical protein
MMGESGQGEMFPEEPAPTPATYPESLYGGMPPHESPVTSLAAAASVATSSNTLRERVYSAIAAAGEWGMTDDEIERETSLRHQTASARRRELVLLGRIKPNGQTRRTSSGRSAQVWVVA